MLPERIKERARLLQDIKGKAKIQQLNTQKQREKMGLWSSLFQQIRPLYNK